MSQLRALVTDARRGSAVAVIRSLGRVGWHVIAADDEWPSPGQHSRYAAERLRYPSPQRHPEAAATTLVQAAKRRHVDLIVPVTDDVILPLLDAFERERPATRLALPAREALETAWDKWETIQLARRLDVPVPRGELAGTAEDALVLAENIGWPVVVKPRHSRIYRRGRPIARLQVRYARDADSLREIVKQSDGADDLIVQEMCPGEGHGLNLLLNDGRLIAGFQHRRLREVPSTGGPSAYRESVPIDRRLMSMSLRLLRALRWTGLAMVEFKVTSDGPRLMEINGRIWGSLPLALVSGVDFPALMANLYVSETTKHAVDAQSAYVTGVRSHDLALELAWIGGALVGARSADGLMTPGRREALAAAASLLRPGDHWDMRSRDDPLPLLIEGSRLVATSAARLRDLTLGWLR